jgi:hypothetical protein
MHSQEIDRLSGSFECDTRISEHHEAASDKNQPDSFFIHDKCGFDFLDDVSNQPFAPGNETDEYDNDGDDQQDVNEPANGVTAHETKQPEDEKNERNSV